MILQTVKNQKELGRIVKDFQKQCVEVRLESLDVTGNPVYQHRRSSLTGISD